MLFRGCVVFWNMGVPYLFHQHPAIEHFGHFQIFAIKLVTICVYTHLYKLGMRPQLPLTSFHTEVSGFNPSQSDQ